MALTDQEIRRQYCRGRGAREIVHEVVLRERSPKKAALARVERVICAGTMGGEGKGAGRK